MRLPEWDKFMRWCDRNPGLTKMCISFIAALIVVLAFAWEPFGVLLAALLFIGLIALMFWAISDIIYSLFFE